MAVQLLAIVTLLVACSSTHRIMTPDGSSAYVIRCRDSLQCFRRAEKVCSRSYPVLSPSDQPATAPTVQVNVNINSALHRQGAAR